MDCKDLVRNRTKLTSDQIDDLFDYFDEIKNDPNARDLMQQRIDGLREAGEQMKQRHILSIQARKAIENHAPDAPDEYAKYRSVLVSSQKHFTDAGNSTEQLQNLWDAQRRLAIGHDITQATGSAKTLNLFNRLPFGVKSEERTAFDLALTKELRGEDGGDELAKTVAGVFKNHLHDIANKAQELGVPIKELDGYSGAQTHDMFKLGKAAKLLGQKGEVSDKEAWKSFIKPLLDNKTFVVDGKRIDPDEFLDHVYDNIMHGKYQTAADEDLAMTPAGLARSLAKHRVLHFKDAESFLKYNHQFGLHEGTGASLINQMGHFERKLALIQKLGPNPRGTLDWMKKNLGKEGRKLDKYYNALTGELNIPEHLRLARAFSMARAYMNVTHLGSSMLSSIPDLGNSAMALRALGVPYAKAYGDVFTNLFSHIGRGVKNPEEMRIARLLGVGFEGMMHRAASRWDTSLPGASSRLSNLMFRVNGQAWWDDVVRYGVAKIAATHLADQAGKSFKDLDGALQAALKRHGINGNDWRSMKSAIEDVNGTKMMLTDGMSDSVKTKYLMMLQDATRTGVPLPGAAEHALWLWGRPGTLGGEVGRAMAQFKYFPTSMLMRVAPKAYYMGLGHLILGYAVPLTVLGYLSGAVKNLTVGQYPDDPMEAKTWFDAFSKGGAASYLGDLILHNFSYGHSFMDLIGGPIGGTINDLGRIYSIGKGEVAGKATQAQATEALKLLFKQIPYANLAYTKAAVDSLMLDPLLDTVNPGYVEREKMRDEKQYGQRSFIK